MRPGLCVLLVPIFVAACATGPTSPYAGQQERHVKALAPDEVEGYLAGKGMGFAKPAELNGYPGPMHVVELADPLKLTAEQRSAASALLKRHKAEVQSLGSSYVEAEKDLDRLFATRAVNAKTLEEALRKSADLQRQIRESHLSAHLEIRAMLSPAQVAEYARLRGYGGRESHGH